MLRRAVAAVLVLGAAAGKDEGCSSFGMSGFSNPQLKDKWWARHPKLTLNGLPTYWTGAAQNSPGWESTGLLFMYWCNIGPGGWYIEGNDIAKREKIFTDGDCSGLARRSDANKEIKTGDSTWLEGDSQNPVASTVSTSMCTGIQLNSCIAECKDLPTGIPFDTCVPLTTCGSRSGMTTHVKIVTTKQDQKTWDTVTYQIYSDQNCSFAVAGRDDPPATLRCDQCEPLLGNAMVPCTAMQDLKPEAESSNGVIMGIALTLLLLAIVLLVFYCSLRGTHEKMKQTRDGWQNAREMREPLINDNDEDSPQEEIDALTEKIARYYEDSGKPLQHPCAEVAKLAMQQSDNPNQLLFNKLKDKHPEDRGLLADIFLGGLSSSPAAGGNSPPSTPPEQRDVEEALVAAEANRKAREAEEYERQRQESLTPPPVEGKTKSKKKAGKTRPAAAVEENWDEPTKKEPVDDWNDTPKKPEAVEENWDEPAKKPAAKPEEENWDEPAKKPAAKPEEENWDDAPAATNKDADVENWDEPKAKATPEQESWDDAPAIPAAAVVPKKSDKKTEDEDWDEPAVSKKTDKKAKAAPEPEESWDEPSTKPASKPSADDEAWEDEQPAPKKAAAKEESWDEPAAVPKKATAAEEAWDEEPPKPKKVEESWDDAPPASKNNKSKPATTDEAWDDVPAAAPSKAKGTADEEAWDDAPVPSKAKPAPATTDDNWEDEKPAPKTKAKPKQKPQKDDEWEDENVVLRKVDKPDAKKKATDEEWDAAPVPKKAPQPSKKEESWDDEPAPAKTKTAAKPAPEESWDETPTPSKAPKASAKRDEEEDWGAEPTKAKGPGHVKKGQMDKWDEDDQGENFKNVKLRKTEKPENWDEGAGQDEAWDDAPAAKTKKPAEETWDEEPAKKPAGNKDEAWQEEEDNWEDSTPAKKTVPKKATGGGKEDAWEEDGSELAGKLAARRAAEPADNGWVDEVEWDDAIDAADEDADWGDTPIAVVPTSPIEKEKHQNRQPTGLEVRVIEASNISGADHNIQVLLASKGQRVRKTGVRDVDGNVVKWDQKFKMKLPENSLPMNLQFRIQHGRDSIGETTLRLDDSSFHAGSDYLRKLDVAPQGTLVVEAAPMYYDGGEGGEMDDELQSILAKRRLQQENQS